MRTMNGDGGPVLPWLLIRQDVHGNRYRVGSYATRAEAQRTAGRLGRVSPDAPGAAEAAAGGAGADSYLVECRDHASGARG